MEEFNNFNVTEKQAINTIAKGVNRGLTKFMVASLGIIALSYGILIGVCKLLGNKVDNKEDKETSEKTKVTED